MIEVNNLTKKYGRHTAVDDISFVVNDGEILGFLGPNGAGKTTTMNIITGYISSTDGSVKINGFDILAEPEKAKKHIGYLPDVPPLYPDMTVTEYLKFVCDIKNVKKSDWQDMLTRIINIVKIDEVKNRLTKNLSKGYRQRVGLAQALIGFPEVLILDEPMNGLDPKQIIEMRDVITDLGKSHTILLSSHILSEVSAVCDRVMIINKGKIVASDAPDRLSEQISKTHTLYVRVKGTKDAIENALMDSPNLENIEFSESHEPETCDLTLQGSEEMDIREEVFNIFSKNKLPILTMKPLNMTLEEIFLQVTEGNDHTIGAEEQNSTTPAEEISENDNEAAIAEQAEEENETEQTEEENEANE